MKSSSSVGPRSPALSEFWLSAIGTPWLVVSTRPPESTRTRSSGPTVGLKLTCGLPRPTFSDAFTSVSVLPPTIGCGGSTACPCGGAIAASPNSPGLAALCGIADASASAPAIFAVAASEMASAPPLRVGPLTVALADDLAAARVELVPVLPADERADERAVERAEGLGGGFLEGIWKPVIESQP